MSNTICPRRWNFADVRVNTSEVRMCCHTFFKKIEPGESLTNNDYVKERRLEMLKGIKHSDCDYCWKLEDQGLQSKRTVELTRNEWDREKYDSLVANNHNGITIDDPILLTDKIDVLSITLENTCDLKCSYCRGNYSSQWAVEDLKRGVIDIKTYREWSKDTDTQFLDSLWSMIDDQKDNLLSIGVTGGEPTIIPNFYKIIDKLLDDSVYNPDRIMYMFTNGNSDAKQLARLEEAITKITKKFKFRINISIESIGAQAEYIRYGLDWNRFNSNVDRLLEIASTNKNLIVCFGPTVSAISVPQFDKFIEWAMDKERKYEVQIPFHQNTVKSPEYDRPESLPVEFKKSLDRAIDHLKNALFTHEQYIKFMEACRDSIGTNVTTDQSFYDFYKKYDSIRETNFVETFPELADFYNECNKTNQR